MNAELAVFWGVHLQWFAAEDEGRTEEPTEFKLRKAREEGRIPKSQELAGALILLFPVIVLAMMAPSILRDCVDLFRYYFERSAAAKVTDTGIAQGFFYYFVKMILPVVIAAVVSAIAANLIQTRGFLFTTKPITPDFSRIIPNFPRYFARSLFSFEGAFNLLKSLAKVAVTLGAAYVILRGDWERLLSLSTTGLWNGVSHVAGMTARLLITAAVIFLAISIPDYIVQRRQFMESMKMTKQEVKDEYKELEGDPFTKRRIRQSVRELMSRNMPQNVAQSDVVITNPTHFAVALKFDQRTMPAPQVMAKGQDAAALRIKEIARQNNIPIEENKPLARALYAELDVGDFIPEKYFTILSIIFGKIYNLKGRTA
ncbi:MAG: flagellar biosynthesis protein FlhB [Spirochaetaceae bacterium]|nr:flagellar biosynthesis protein FlhB [Spirochaetaceae bacterium]